MTSLLFPITMRPWTWTWITTPRLPLFCCFSGAASVRSNMAQQIIVWRVFYSFFSGEMSNRFLKSSSSSEASHVLRDFAKNVEETRSSSKTWRTHPKTERTSWFGKIGLYRRLFIHWLRRIIWSYVHHMSLVFLICFQVKNELTTSIEDGKGEVSFS